MKKILNKILLLALFVLVPAFIVSAESGTNNSEGTITINNAIVGKEYKAYQVLVLESYNTDKKAYTYKIAAGWENFFDATKTEGKGAAYVTIDDTKDSEGVVTWKDLGSKEANEAAAKTFAQEALKYAKAKPIAAKDTQEAKTTTVKFEGLNLGYYLIDSSVGALCSLTTTKPNATATEKNTVPTVKKEVKNNGTYASENTASVGDTVEFKTTINVGNGAETYKLYDKMSKGLTLDEETIKVYLNGSLVDKTDNYSVNTTRDDYTFVIEFTEKFVKDLDSEDVITVTYSALLNEDAVMGDDGNTNETFLKYGNDTEVNKTPTDTTITKTYEFSLYKTDKNGILLSGAEFKLYKNVSGEKVYIKLIKLEAKDSQGTTYYYYRVATPEEIKAGTNITETIEAGNVDIKGLEKGTYYLEETVAPDGYNKLTSPIEVVLNSSNLLTHILMDENGTWTYTGGIQVKNYTGDEMPTTGGMGTMLFITIGSIMVLGFGVLLVTKLRMSKMSA